MTLKQYMEYKQVSRIEMAQRLGISASGLDKILAKVRTPRPALMRKIIKETDDMVRVEDLLG